MINKYLENNDKVLWFVIYHQKAFDIENQNIILAEFEHYDIHKILSLKTETSSYFYMDFYLAFKQFLAHFLKDLLQTSRFFIVIIVIIKR